MRDTEQRETVATCYGSGMKPLRGFPEGKKECLEYKPGTNVPLGRRSSGLSTVLTSQYLV